MLLCDVNVLLYAHREDAPNHSEYLGFVEEMLEADASFGMSSLVLSGFLRVATHRRIFDPPSSMEHALEFADQLWSHPNCSPITPGVRHWRIFQTLCESCGVKGNLVPDAYFAALAIEAGCEWVTTDRDFARFTGLVWRHPLSGAT